MADHLEEFFRRVGTEPKDPHPTYRLGEGCGRCMECGHHWDEAGHNLDDMSNCVGPHRHQCGKFDWMCDEHDLKIS